MKLCWYACDFLLPQSFNDCFEIVLPSGCYGVGPFPRPGTGFLKSVNLKISPPIGELRLIAPLRQPRPLLTQSPSTPPAMTQWRHPNPPGAVRVFLSVWVWQDVGCMQTTQQVCVRVYGRRWGDDECETHVFHPYIQLISLPLHLFHPSTQPALPLPPDLFNPSLCACNRMPATLHNSNLHSGGSCHRHQGLPSPSTPIQPNIRVLPPHKESKGRVWVDITLGRGTPAPSRVWWGWRDAAEPTGDNM